MIPSISDIIIASTLVVNALAVLNFQLKKQEPNFGEQQPGVLDKAREILRNLRFLRLLIVLWNVVVIGLMFLLFS